MYIMELRIKKKLQSISLALHITYRSHTHTICIRIIGIVSISMSLQVYVYSSCIDSYFCRFVPRSIFVWYFYYPVSQIIQNPSASKRWRLAFSVKLCLKQLLAATDKMVLDTLGVDFLASFNLRSGPSPHHVNVQTHPRRDFLRQYYAFCESYEVHFLTIELAFLLGWSHWHLYCPRKVESGSTFSLFLLILIVDHPMKYYFHWCG